MIKTLKPEIYIKASEFVKVFTFKGLYLAVDNYHNVLQVSQYDYYNLEKMIEERKTSNAR